MRLEFTTVAVTVSNGKKAAEWYRNKLGFEVRGEVEGHWVVVAPEGSKTGLHLCQSDTLEPGNTGILFTTPDIEAAIKELEAKGVKITKELTKRFWGTYIMFADPDGNEFCLMSHN